MGPHSTTAGELMVAGMGEADGALWRRLQRCQRPRRVSLKRCHMLAMNGTGSSNENVDVS
jgi:hypothetical protein